MKKTKLIMASALLVGLCGCTDAQAKLKDSSTAVMAVGSQNITKGEIYTVLSSAYGANAVINDAVSRICAAEVEVTDEMRTEAEGSLESMKALYDDSFLNYLESSGMSEEDYLNEVILPGLQADELPKRYIDENYDSLVEKYHPVLATVLDFTSEEDANKALSALRDGSKNAEEAAVDCNSTSSGLPAVYTIEDTTYDAVVTGIIRNSSPDDGWAMVTGTDGAFHILHVDNNDPATMKEAVTEKLAGLSAVSTDVMTYYFKKYGFHVYDKPLYDELKENYPGYLVQDIKDGE